MEAWQLVREGMLVTTGGCTSNRIHGGRLQSAHNPLPRSTTAGLTRAQTGRAGRVAATMTIL